MKRSIIVLTAVITIASLLILCVCIDQKNQTLFYSPSEQQDRIYELIMSSEELKAELDAGSLTVIKESIAPMYGIDLAEYSKTGELKADQRLTVGDDRWVYIAKVITAKGDFAANLRMYIGADSFFYSLIESYDYAVAENISDDYWYLESWSYADHAEEIMEILGSDTIIPASDVKYVYATIGDFFYIDNDQYKVLIPVGIYTAREVRQTAFGIIAGSVLDVQRLDLGGRQLKEIADYYLEWSSGEPVDGNLLKEYISRECTLVNNITDINGYLGIEDDTVAFWSFSRYGIWIVCGAVAAVAVCLGTIAVLAVRRVKKKKAANT